jgi:hypothetical protein
MDQMSSEKAGLDNIERLVIIVNKFAAAEGHCLFDRWIVACERSFLSAVFLMMRS